MKRNWRDSASESYAHNYKHAIANHEFSFEVDEAEKDELEITNCVELDDWFEDHFKLVPHTYKFEQFWNGVEDVYTCNAYWN